jgi:hypothetical protein
MNQRKILNSFHNHLKDLMLMYGFVKIADTYVKLSGDRDSAIILNIRLIRTDWSSFEIQPKLIFHYLYEEYLGPIDVHLSDGNIRANINDFLPSYLRGMCQETSDDFGDLYYEFQGLGSLSMNRAYVSINIIHESFIDFYMKTIEQILRCELLQGLQVENFVSIVEFIDDMRRRRPFKSYDTFSDNFQLNFPWGFLVLHDQTEPIKNEEELKCMIWIENMQHELALNVNRVDQTLRKINSSEADSESGRKQRKSLEYQLETAKYNVSIYRSKLDELLNKRDYWRNKVNHPETEKAKIYLGYQKYLSEVLLLMENKKSKPKKTQKVIPPRIPVIDNLERIVIRRGAENWKQIQTYMDEFFKTKGYHRTSDREMWERTWCIVETQSFWIIMELDESGITNEHLNDYDQLSKHLTKVLVTSGFFLYSFEFSESLARLYDQGECVDHWVIDEVFEVDEQEVSQPLAWESSKIANPYRMKDPEEVHLIDILYDWMEMLKINPQWMVEEVDSTQNFKKCHIFGYAIARKLDV